MIRHQCPICGVLHEISDVRARFAYGRQLACGVDCEAERRRHWRRRYWQMAGPPAGDESLPRNANDHEINDLMLSA